MRFKNAISEKILIASLAFGLGFGVGALSFRETHTEKPVLETQAEVVKLLSFSSDSVLLISNTDVNLSDYALRKQGTKRLLSLRGHSLVAHQATTIPLQKGFITQKNTIELVKLEVKDAKRDSNN